MDGSTFCGEGSETAKSHVSSNGVRLIVNNVYSEFRVDNPGISVREAVRLCAKYTKVSERTIFRIIKEVEVKEKPPLGGGKK